MKLLINQDDLETLLFLSFRYALGRSTYVTGEVADLINKHQGCLGTNTKDVIKKDICNAIDKGQAGMQMDVDEWLKLVGNLG